MLTCMTALLALMLHVRRDGKVFGIYGDHIVRKSLLFRLAVDVDIHGLVFELPRGG